MSLPNDLIQAVSLGWHVFPVSSVSKRTCFDGAIDNATTGLRLIEEWDYLYSKPNWRVHMGKSGLLALDIDKPGSTHDADGFSTMRKLVRKHGRLPDGPRIKTGGSGGCVAFFRLTDANSVRGGPGLLGPGIDVMRGRVCPTIPPSYHQRTKNPYLWMPGHAPWEIETPDVPKWLMDALKPLPAPDYSVVDIDPDRDISRILDLMCEDIRSAPSGGSNRVLCAKAFRMGEFVRMGKLTRTDAETMLMRAAVDRRIPANEARAVIRSSFRG